MEYFHYHRKFPYASFIYIYIYIYIYTHTHTFSAVLHGLWALTSVPGIEPLPPVLEARSLVTGRPGNPCASFCSVPFPSPPQLMMCYDCRSVFLYHGSGDGNGNPLQCCLENSMDRGAKQGAVHGVTKSRT